MPLMLETIPCLTDNYAYLLHDPASGETALVDAPEAGPILARLNQRGWALGQILITHHHPDHIGGVAEVVAATGARVLGAGADAHRLPPLSRALAEGDALTVGTHGGRVIEVPGHTRADLAFVFDGAGAGGETLAFTGDSLMSGGCGRLFEGTAAQMWASLQKLCALPDTTWVCSGHEYTAANLAFAAQIEPDNAALQGRIQRVAAARAAGRGTVPSRLAGERATNPFLRVDQPAIRQAVGAGQGTDIETFALLRQLKNNFRG
jgi:hydroxyacylglutathione hydrolase